MRWRRASSDPSSFARGGVAPAADGDDPTAEREGQVRHGLADRPETDDADRHVAQLGAFQRLPRSLALQLQELGQPATDREDHHQDVFGDRVD
ncbi:MAG: hypothetical protein WKF78_13680 [Candidatus Limnocylindrales bacterium]